MRVLMLDDSFEFDGSSTADRPMGGAEKAFANLAAALAVALAAAASTRSFILAWAFLMGSSPGQFLLRAAF